MPFRVLIRLLQSHTYNQLVRCVTFTQLTILHANSLHNTVQLEPSHFETNCLALTLKTVSCRELPATVACRKLRLLSQSQSHITTDGQSVSKSCVEPHRGLMTRYLLLFDSYGLVLCGVPSLTRGWVCLLYMLLALASAIFLMSKSLGTRNHILLLRIETSLFVAAYDS
jgi:hypothetical protein